MSLSLRRLAPIAVMVATILLAIVTAAPAHACETGMPHVVHEYESWAAVTVGLLALVSAALLVRRALHR